MNQWWNPLKKVTGSNLVDVGRAAAHAHPVGVGDSVAGVHLTGAEATSKACGVGVARLQGNSWAPPPSTDPGVNVGTVPTSPFLPSRRGGGGQAHRRLLMPGWGGVLVVVRGRESRLHGEGEQHVRSVGSGMPGGRW